MHRFAARIMVVAALLLTTVAIANAQDALPAPDAPGTQRGAFEPPVPFYVPPEYQSSVRVDIVAPTTTADEDNGDCNPGLGAGLSLREILTHCIGGSRTLFLNPGTYVLNSAISVGDFDALTIIGSSPTAAIIKAAGPAGAGADGLLNFFAVEDNPLTIMNLTLENGKRPTTGGAVYVAGFGTVNLYNVVFRGNNTGNNGGAIQFDVGANALLVSLNFVTFEDNHAAEVGGAVSFFAASVTGNSLLVRNSEFIGNTAATASCLEGGGAIEMFMDGGYGDALVIENTTFEDNSVACGNGGAVQVKHNDGSMTVTIEGSTFTDNTAAGTDKSGGALFAHNPYGLVEIAGSTFTGNSAPFGGAVLVTTAESVVISGSVFDGNTATTTGGAVYAETGQSILIASSQFYNNEAASVEGAGGAALLHGNPLTMLNNTIATNTAGGAGGGLFFVGPAGTLGSNWLLDNSAPDGPDCLTEGDAALSLSFNIVSSTADCAIMRQATDRFDNLMVNGSFEAAQTVPTPSEAKPAGWTVKNSTGDKRVCDTLEKKISGLGSCAFIFTGSTGTKASLTQNVDVGGINYDVGDSLLLSAAGLGAKTSKVQVQLTVTFTDGTPKATKKFSFSGKTDNYLMTVADPLLLAGSTLGSVSVKISDKSLSGKFYLDFVFLSVQPPAPAPRDTRSGDVLPPPPAPSGFRGGN